MALFEREYVRNQAIKAKEEQKFLQLVTGDGNNRIYLKTVLNVQTMHE
jgi:hypothetical protein